MKPGIKTTEFWLLIFGFLLVVFSGLTVERNEASFRLDLELAKWWLGGLLAYVGARSWVKTSGKSGVPKP